MYSIKMMSKLYLTLFLNKGIGRNTTSFHPFSVKSLTDFSTAEALLVIAKL